MLAVLTSTGLVHAGENPFKPEPKLKDAKVSSWNIGAGVTKKLLHANLEWVNSYGIAYAKAGAFLNDDNEAGGQVGFRYPYYLTGTDKNGYYVGVYAGHLDSKNYGGKVKALWYRDWETDRKSTRLNSSHITRSRMPSSA